VSYALDLAVDVRRVFATLPIELQEAVLDEVDRITAWPPAPDSEDGRDSSEAVAELAGVRHYAFFVYVRDTRARLVGVESMGYLTKEL
jgi:hypothetical protein